MDMFLQNPRFEDNGDIGSCDNFSDVTKNKVTAIFSENFVSMLTDNPTFTSVEAGSPNGKDIEKFTTSLSRHNRSNSTDASGTSLACSINKVGITNIIILLILLN